MYYNYKPSLVGVHVHVFNSILPAGVYVLGINQYWIINEIDEI